MYYIVLENFNGFDTDVHSMGYLPVARLERELIMTATSSRKDGKRERERERETERDRERVGEGERKKKKE